MTYIIYKDSLQHHGVKGMKWGVRHDKPTSGLRKRRDKVGDSKKTGLTKKQKVAIGVVAGTAALAVTGFVLYKSGNIDKLASLGKAAANKGGIINDITTQATQQTLGHASELSSRIKPQNRLCNFNSFAAGLPKKLGLSLKDDAGGKYINNVTDFLNKALKNPDNHIFDTIPPDVYKDKTRLSNAILRIAKNTEGASGQISSDLIKGGGHAFNWRVEGGEVKFFDTFAKYVDKTTGEIVRGPIEDASGHLSRITGVNGKITRLDNITEDDLVLSFIDTIFNRNK